MPIAPHYIIMSDFLLNKMSAYFAFWSDVVFSSDRSSYSATTGPAGNFSRF